VGIQEVSWDTRGSLRAGDNYYFYGKENHQFARGVLYPKE